MKDGPSQVTSPPDDRPLAIDMLRGTATGYVSRMDDGQKHDALRAALADAGDWFQVADALGSARAPMPWPPTGPHSRTCSWSAIRRITAGATARSHR